MTRRHANNRMWIRVFWFLLLVAFVQPVAPASNGPVEEPTLKTLAAANARNADAIHTIVVKQTVVATRKERPGEQEKSREYLTHWAEEQNRLQTLAAAGAGPDASERIQREQAERLASVDAAVRAWRLNKSVKVARTKSIDFAKGRARRDDRDLRDLERLASDNGLPPWCMGNLTRSASHILAPDRSTDLKSETQRAVVLPQPRFDARGERLALGIIPAPVFDDGTLLLDVASHGRGSGPDIEVVGRDAKDGRKVLCFAVRPEFGYRLTRWTVYGSDEEPLEDLTASEFKQVDGVFVPFRSELHRSAYGIPSYHVERTTVESVHVNVALADDLFEIPAGYRVQDIVTGGRLYTKPGKPAAPAPGHSPPERPGAWEKLVELPSSRPATRPADQPATQPTDPSSR